MMTSVRAAALACALLSTTAMTAPAIAQIQSTTPLPARSTVDGNGVNLATGRVSIPKASVSIGGPGNGLAYTLQLQEGQEYGSMFGWITTNGSIVTVTLGTSSEQFTLSGGVYTPVEARGSSFDGSNYVRADGTRATFGSVNGTTSLIWVTRPNGERLTYNYAGDAVVTGTYPNISITTYVRLASIQSSNGYMLVMGYQGASIGGDGLAAWQTLISVRAVNMAVETCSTTSCTNTSSWPTLSMAWNGTNRTWSYTDSLSGVSVFTYDTSGRITGVKLPGSASNDITYVYNASGRVSSATNAGITTTYAYADAAGVRTTTVTSPGSVTRVLTFDIADGTVLTDRNEVNQTTQYQYDSSNRLTRVTAPEGNYVRYSYDSRGNVTETRAVAKTSPGGADIVTSATYPASCTNVLTCNRPTTTTDARNNVTTYSWDATHGGLLSITSPAVGGVSPQTRFGYTALQAYYRNGSGVITASGQTTYMPTSVSACQTNASCIGTADEVRTTTAYGSAGVANNLLPTAVTVAAGDNSLTATSTMAYDSVGNLVSVDGPLSGTADTTFNRYDALRRPVGTIGPDPDGGGALLRRAQRVTYNSSGLVTEVEAGTVTGTSDTAWAAFSTLQEAQTTYDANDRPTVQRLVSGSTTYALTQTSYDTRGRVQCVAQRMNPAQFSSLPSDACTLDTQGSFGPDRIRRLTYDAASRVTQVQTGYGVTGVAAADVTTAYTNNSQVQHVTDAEGNRTTYEYDGHDRRVKTRFPSPTTDGVSSTTDYEQLTLDANGNVTNLRNRSNQNIAFTYDVLNRMTLKNLPSPELDVTYSYDLLNRMTGASQTGNALTFTYDALGRNLTQVGPHGTATYEYDAAGRRTQLTYPGTGLYVEYDYLVTGEVWKIRENGATTGVGVLATYGYDNLGRRTSLTRGNGTVTSYGYDPVSRPSQIVQNLTGTTNDLTLDFTHNPASQIATNTRSNDSYAWTAHFAVNRNYTANGLNQYTASGSIVPTYDSRGNLTSAGTTTYTYSSENRLLTATGGVTLAYDPNGRLYQTVGGGVTTRMAYDGQSLIAEYNASNALQRRYVHGPGVDEPLVWYEGTGITDRRWFHADERGSIVAVTNSSGAATTINRYDEYGIPQSTNAGRFQFTGQQWLAELGMYHYRARIYSPTLGRFLQTDPIGYGDGMNMYAYVRNNPVNATDPTGLCGPGDRAPTAQEISACQGSEAAFWVDYHPMDIGGNEMAMRALAQIDGFRATINLIGATVIANRDPFPRRTESQTPSRQASHLLYFQRNDDREIDYYGCIGGGYVVSGGVCYASNGDFYAYIAGGISARPVDVTVGATGDADALLTGWTVSGNGMPGAAVAFDGNGNPIEVGFQTGTPSVEVSYGVNLSREVTNIANTIATGLSNMVWGPVCRAHPDLC